MAIRWGVAATALVMLVTGCSYTPAPSESPAALTIRTGRAPNASFALQAVDLGIHSFTTQPQVPTGTIRLTCSPTWRTVNPVKGQFDWTEMDKSVARAESWGYHDILFSFCGTPQWAGAPTSGPDEAAFGPGAAQPPKDMADWQEYVRQVAERYKGRISGYEVWNEPSSKQFFTGTPALMADMTEVAYRAIKDVDPGAYVLSGSIQTHRTDLYEGFAVPYLKGLSSKGWPVDGIAAHFYPSGVGTPVDRVKHIEKLQTELTTLDAPADLPLWDTEVNYAAGLPGGAPDGRISGDKAAAWTAQTFLDSWRTGVRRTYWYLWTQDYYDFPGIQMRIGDPATTALNVLGAWVAGTTFSGCRTRQPAAITCRFLHDGTESTIAWSQGKPQTIPMAGSHQVCPVTGASCSTETDSIKVTELPIRID